MNQRYEQLEDELTALLQNQFFDANTLPDDEVHFQPSFKPKVFVMYDNSDYPESENLSMTVQEDKMKVGFEIHARTRRGTHGIFAVFKIICLKILGYKSSGCDKLQLISFGPLQGNSPNHWIYYAQFATTSHITECIEEIEGPALKRVTFEDPEDELYTENNKSLQTQNKQYIEI
jgi:hypothetical protein